VDAEVTAMASIPTVGHGEVRFDTLGLEGEPAGRERFERIVTDIIKVTIPLAREVQPNPGDWGIDTFVGDLEEDGTVMIWQSKFFLKPGDTLDSHQAQIRASFKSAMKNATEHGYTVASWTLVVPGTMTPQMTTWFDSWRKRQVKDHGGDLVIDIWQEADLRHRLMQDDFAHVRIHYFGAYPEAPAPAARTLDDPEDPAVYDGALFIRQLHEAQIVQDKPARRAFFNAEIMTRDINERETVNELAELRTMRATVEQMWSTRYETARATATDEDGLLPSLFPDVCSSIERHHELNPNLILRDTAVHRLGLVHHLAETGDVGWVVHFADIAADHASEP
jgi:hypothetical protein